MTGLNPVEHGYLGWYSYVEPLDKIIMLFRGIEKDSQKVNKEYDEIRNKLLINRTITDEINEIGKYKSKILFPFGDNPYKDLDNMLEIIKKNVKKMVRNIFMHMIVNQIVQCMILDQIVMKQIN